MKKIFFLFNLLFISVVLVAQTTITGTVESVDNEKLPGATITVQNDKQGQIIAYAIADFQGKYRLSFHKDLDTILVKVSYLGYQTLERKLPNHDFSLNWKLKPSSEQLREVVIHPNPVEEKKDTITYRVKSLKKKEDRVIVDVIKRIPGITIQKNGQIYYQGKAINKFYIENMDMLEGRYNLASNNLPVDQVASVQVYEHHQPIKLLDSLTYPDRAAINIKLKKNFSYAIPVHLSTGYSPVLWDANITPLLFTKKYQSLINLQTNNAGKDLEDELTDFSLFETKFSIKRYLQIAQISKPDYDKKWWLDNETYMMSFNFLTALSKSTTVKVNTDYFYDLRDEQFASNQNIFLSAENILINESVNNDYCNQKFKTAVIVEQNSKKNYLKNKFLYESEKDTEDGYISNIQTGELLEVPYKKIKNDFYWLFPVGKQLLGVKSEIKYIESDQFLTISPGRFAEVFNNSTPYEKGTQFVSQNKWFVKNSLGLAKKLGKINLKNDIELKYISGNMKSKIIINTGLPVTLGNEFQNDNDNEQLILSNNLDISIKTGTWRFGVQLPVKYDYLRQIENIADTEQDVNDVNINPDIWMTKYMNRFTIRASVSKNHKYSDIFEIYSGKIWNLYNSIEQHNMPVNRQVNTRLTFLTVYKNVLKGLNASLSSSYFEKENQYVYAYQINTDGSKQLYAVAKPNVVYSNSFSFQMAKYFFSTKTNVKFNVLYFNDNHLENINDDFLRIKSNDLKFLASVDFSLTRYLSIYLHAKLDYFYSSYIDSLSENYQYNYSGTIYLYPFENQKIKLYFDYYENNLTNTDKNMFINLSYQYKIPKKHTEFHIEWRNITNKKQYFEIHNFGNIRLENTYQLRPSQVIAGVRFSI